MEINKTLGIVNVFQNAKTYTPVNNHFDLFLLTVTSLYIVNTKAADNLMREITNTDDVKLCFYFLVTGSHNVQQFKLQLVNKLVLDP